MQLPLQAVIYGLVTVVILQLTRGRGWARILLTVVLGGVGLFSLLAEPTVAVIVLRAAHVVAVVVALVLMYRPAANRYFRSSPYQKGA